MFENACHSPHVAGLLEAARDNVRVSHGRRPPSPRHRLDSSASGAQVSPLQPDGPSPTPSSPRPQPCPASLTWLPAPALCPDGPALAPKENYPGDQGEILLPELSPLGCQERQRAAGRRQWPCVSARTGPAGHRDLGGAYPAHKVQPEAEAEPAPSKGGMGAPAASGVEPGRRPVCSRGEQTNLQVGQGCTKAHLVKKLTF